MEIINIKNQKMKSSTNNQKKSYLNAKICYIWKEKFKDNAKNKKDRKVRDHCHKTVEYRGAAHSICNLKYNVPKSILQFF